MTGQMQRIVLASRPEAQASEENFRLESLDIPQPGDGEVLVKVSLYVAGPPI